MKRIKIGIAAIIGLLAMSFTIASHEGAFSKKNSKRDTYTCLKNVDFKQISYCNGTTKVIIDRTTATGFPTSLCGFDEVLQDPLPGDLNYQCTGDNNYFCCADLDETQSCTYRENCSPTGALKNGKKFIFHYKETSGE